MHWVYYWWYYCIFKCELHLFIALYEALQDVENYKSDIINLISGVINIFPILIWTQVMPMM